MFLQTIFKPRNIFLAGLYLTVIALPLSAFLMSLGQIIMAIGWISEGNYRNKLVRFWSHPSAVLITGLFLLHFIGLAYSNNTYYAFSDIRVKIPLFTLPFMISSAEPFDRKNIYRLLGTLIICVFISTLVSTAVWLDIVHRPYGDIRDICIFISHIRLSLLICFSIFMLAFYLQRNPDASILLKTACCVLIAWFICFLCILQSATGIFLLILLTFYLVFRYTIFHFSGVKRVLTLMILFCIPALFVTTVYLEAKKMNSIHAGYISNYPIRTANGNLYNNSEVKRQDRENGYPLWISICIPELKKEWEKRSVISFNGKDKKGQEIQFTILRYLTSKGLRKDSAGLASLHPSEIKAIEKGITNVYFISRPGFISRFQQLIWEFNTYREGGDVNGHSLSQRFVYWETALHIIEQHPIWGVGTGDVQDAFNEYYDKNHIHLDPVHRYHSHNQFLTFAVSFGIPGLLYFLLVLIFPFIEFRKTGYIFSIYYAIFILSMLTEDTLESQAGVTIYAFFTALLLFGGKDQLTQTEAVSDL